MPIDSDYVELEDGDFSAMITCRYSRSSTSQTASAAGQQDFKLAACRLANCNMVRRIAIA